MTQKLCDKAVEETIAPRQQWLNPIEAEELRNLGGEIDEDPDWSEAERDGYSDCSALGVAALTRRALLIHRFRELWIALRSGLSAAASGAETPERFTHEQWRELADTALFAKALGLDPLKEPSVPDAGDEAPRVAGNPCGEASLVGTVGSAANDGLASSPSAGEGGAR